jgi:outer membrane protein OmpA-like peptidoglycan-associated protein
MRNPLKIILASILIAFALLCFASTMSAQEHTFRDAAWRYGVHLGVNYNSGSLGYQNLHEPFPNFNKPNANTNENINGTGLGGYGGAFVEYLTESWWGVQLKASYDMRNALVTDIYAVPTHTEFRTRMSYLSFEPGFRIDQHAIPGLSLVFGPLVAVNIHGTYDFKPDVNGPTEELNIKVPDRSVASLGVSAGLAYDIEASRGEHSSFYVSPFFDYSWIAAQRKSVVTRLQNSSNDIWSTQTFRFGIRLSWESRSKPAAGMTEIIYVPVPTPVKAAPAPVESRMTMVMPQDNTINTKNIKGYFPVHPYVFFDKGNKNIPARYVSLSKSDAQKFSETDLETIKPANQTEQKTNVGQLMSTYYNVMNMYGDRMRRNPKEQLLLRGCDPLEVDGESSALKVKGYLVDNYGIDPKRITIIVEPPKKLSGGPNTDPSFASLIDDENRRVVFVFTNPDMYKPVSYTIRDESAIDNDMIFSMRTSVPYKSWTVTITGQGKSLNYGPFTSATARISPEQIMRGRDEGEFNAKTNITMTDGSQATEDADFTLYKNKTVKNASRYLMIFDYNKSDAVATYETKIRKEITPGMLAGNTVIIHGHTDIIGNEAGNQKLSQERADEAKRIVDDELGKESKSVSVQALGVGQTNVAYTFENKYPEGRMYNRNVFVEIIQ